MSITDRLVDEDPIDAPGDVDAVVNTLKETVTRSSEPEVEELDAQDQQGLTEATEEAQPVQKQERPEWIEAKYWDGDMQSAVEKQAKAYRELHSAYGRMANDLGHQRKITDQLLLGKRDADLNQAQPEKPKREKRIKVDTSALIDKPEEVLDEYFAQREEQLREEWAQEQRKQALHQEEQAFMAKYPDFQETVASEDFNKWVTSSPLRLRAAQLAAQGDYRVADELLTEYGAIQGEAPAPVERDNGDDKEGARKVTLESSANAPAAKGGPIYRRADLIALKQNRPDVYGDPTFQEEILRAYAEGRVK